MRTIQELINTEDDAIHFLKEWKDSASNHVEFLNANHSNTKDKLYQTQVTTRSPMGAIIYHTGGILIDSGWIRIYGGGTDFLKSLPDFNMDKTFVKTGEAPTFLIIADDAVGGFYFLNGGKFGKDVGKVYYLSPDNIEFEPLDLTYTDFIHFCFNGDLNTFYKDLRWHNWKLDFQKLKCNEAFIFYPYLWTKEGNDIEKVSRKTAPVEEVYQFKMSVLKSLTQ